MREIEKLIKEIREKENTVTGPMLNKINRDKKLKAEAEELTEFLNDEYETISLGQRIYHIWFNSGIEKCCYCNKNKKFSVYQRFSPDRNKKDSNYYNYCGSIECLIEDFKMKGGSGQGYGALIAKISGDPNYREQLLSKTEFLNPHYKGISDSQRFYHIFFNKLELEKCEFCDSRKTFNSTNKFSETEIFEGGKNYCRTCGTEKCIALANVKYTKLGVFEKHGVDNTWDIPGYRENLENSNMEKYGAKYYTGTKEFREKVEETFKENWGGHPTKHKSVQDKKKETCMNKYGIDCILKDQELMKRSMMEKYGVGHNMQDEGHKINHKKIMYERHGGILHQSEEISNKIKETNIRIFGSESPLHNENIADKQSNNSKKFKDYIFDSGRIIKIQGYENLALDILLKEFNEYDILTGRSEISDYCGKFYYNTGRDKHRYYPDIYIKSKNLIIEVKSEYTFSQDLEINKLKKESVLKNNNDFKYMLFSNKKKFLGYY